MKYDQITYVINPMNRYSEKRKSGKTEEINISSVEENESYKTRSDFLFDNFEHKLIKENSFQLQKNFQGIEEIIIKRNINSGSRICSLIETRDNKIATGGGNGSISICSLDNQNKKWNRDIYKAKAHDDCVYTLCEMIDKRILSGSRDKSIKIWEVSENDIILLQTLTNHLQ